MAHNTTSTFPDHPEYPPMDQQGLSSEFVPPVLSLSPLAPSDEQHLPNPSLPHSLPVPQQNPSSFQNTLHSGLPVNHGFSTQTNQAPPSEMANFLQHLEVIQQQQNLERQQNRQFLLQMTSEIHSLVQTVTQGQGHMATLTAAFLQERDGSNSRTAAGTTSTMMLQVLEAVHQAFMAGQPDLTIFPPAAFPLLRYLHWAPATPSLTSRCLRGANGTPLSSAEYGGVKEAVRQVFMQDLAPLAIADEQRNLGTDIKRSMTWYKEHHREKWWSAIAKIEYHQEIVGLCANHWKAEQLLSNTITSYNTLSPKRLDSLSPIRTGKHRRSPSESSSQKKRKRRTDSGGTSALDHDEASGIGGSGLDTQNSEMEDEIAQLQFIKVISSHKNLRDILQSEYGTITNAQQLLDAMEANPDFQHQEPSPAVVNFVKRIEEACPSSELGEDERNEGWGHYQFTAGGVTCRSVLCDWKAVGNTTMARRLITAAIKTCKVARSWCELLGVQPKSYLSDTYLDILVNHLWDIWQAAGGPVVIEKGKQTAGSSTNGVSRPPTIQCATQAAPRTLDIPSGPQTDNIMLPPPSTSRSRASSVNTTTQQLDQLSVGATSSHSDLQAFTIVQLKDWLAEYKIDTPKTKPKAFYIREILTKIGPGAEDIATRLKGVVGGKTKKKSALS
ncbi:hypothetical protein AGABI1DRAFT_91851 [Agaricus bisporus var. burnettii JB137-S8]|uniref:SAP domain-containing protein n=1 Tax=Agaricus bisporus var. burnettii (strain JB137-S8 / ATCC MYA-4627 / FGSC 10392) TaxID=597362 RepID=K5XVQ7_AGABU|nr:uncharacterized protein AGABI1DRAFT_91851 [Agaricus bisporus var. burnettii JB137-S8]EKM79260.1 hypothetical protein AGABI1DRAFT_91851 [Agaricus bisporus var. burnettii JB137-S8]